MIIGYLVFLQLIYIFGSNASPLPDEDMMKQIMQELNDPNLHTGFDLQAFRKNQLDLHNYYRQLHGVPLMTEDCRLTTHAQDYAEELANENNGAGVDSLIHCSNKEHCNPHGEGENLAMAWGSTHAETNATKAWYDEIWFYDFCSTDASLKRPGHGDQMVGHFTQVVWKTSTKLGIGYARNEAKDKVFVVARYMEHGNVHGTDQFSDNVLKPNYIFNTYQDNCNAIQGGYSAWSAPSECTRSCGGGVRLQTRTCTNPKPSFNGADCNGKSAQLASQEWCNEQNCPGDKSHLDLQCEERGETPKGNLFPGESPCRLYCLRSTTYYPAGTADDGTHCQGKRVTGESYNGACVQNECIEMPDYVAPTTAPPTNPAGQVTGSYNGKPTVNWWDTMIFEVPNGVTSVTIKNQALSTAELFVGYYYVEGNTRYMVPVWREDWQTSGIVTGVTFSYEISTTTITMAGPIQPSEPNHTVAIFVKARVADAQADITWSYTP